MKGVEQQIDINIVKEDVDVHLKEIPNGKNPGTDGLHGFWWKKSSSFHQLMV